MFIGKRRWNGICSEVIERLEREKAKRMEALNEICAERKKAYEQSKRLEDQIWRSTCGVVLGAMYGFYSYDKKKFIYLLPTVAAAGYLLNVTNGIFRTWSGRYTGSRMCSRTFPCKELLPYIPVSLNDARLRQSGCTLDENDTNSDMYDCCR